MRLSSLLFFATLLFSYSASQALVGGELLTSSPASKGVAGIIIADSQGEPKMICVGSLISADTVLTAGHCLSEFKNPKIYVVFSKTPLDTLINLTNEGVRLGLKTPEEFEQHFPDLYKAVSFAVHPSFVLSPQDHCDGECIAKRTAKHSEFDLGVIKLRRPVVGGKILKLPTVGETSNIKSVHVIGCGVETFQPATAVRSDTSYKPRMKEANFDKISSSNHLELIFPTPVFGAEAQKSIVATLSPALSSNGPYFMIAETINHMVEEGDSGAPALINNGSDGSTIIGVHSMNLSLDTSPGFATFVNLRSPAVNAWVKKQIK